MSTSSRLYWFNFYPRSPCGERPAAAARRPRPVDFYPRSPCGERRQNYKCFEWIKAFLSTLSLRRATNPKMKLSLMIMISIHALLAESDQQDKHRQHHERGFLSTLSLRRATRANSFPHAPPQISIHALLAESDLTIMLYDTSSLIFLSTLSLRRATRYGRPIDVQLVFLSTLSLRRATYQQGEEQANQSISIHALLAESDVAQVLAVGRA